MSPRPILIACAFTLATLPALAVDEVGRTANSPPASLGPLPETRVTPADAEQHYGVTRGRCNRLMVGAVLGGTVAPGERIGGGGERATPVGRLDGGLLGGDSDVDVADAERGCAQQVLEFGADDAAVGWRHGEVRFRMTPQAASGAAATRCRDFELVATGGLLAGRRSARACRVSDAAWQVQD